MRKVLTLLALVLAAGFLAVLPAHAYEPAQGGMFNVPRPWGSSAEKYKLVRHVERAIRRTPGPTANNPDPTILISTYLLDRSQSVDALIKACRRGVSVRVIMDSDIDNRNSRRLIKKLNGDNVRDNNGDGVADSRPSTRRCGRPLNGRLAARANPLTTDKELRASMRAPSENPVTWGKDRSYAKKCDGSCRGAGGNMHSKFFAFSKTGTAKNVVIVSSSNLNFGGAALGWNDMYTLKNRPKSFQGYLRIHREMTDDTRAGGGKVEIVDGPFVSRFFPMRQAGKKKDPTLQDLKRIGCRSAFGPTRIHISMFYWKGVRGDYLADRLLKLARDGCKVSVIYGAPSRDMAARLKDAARRGLIDLHDSRWDFNLDGAVEIRTHAKYVLVKGRFGADRSAHMVMTGSQNWVAGSLSRGDENTLNIARKNAYTQYLRNWNEIRQHSKRFPAR
jgi:phosphatidylserine/phosphatidylglycerophosphate/cardiolipin synthase-like enzyme